VETVTPDPQTAREYLPQEVRAAHSVMLELAHILGEYRNDMVIVGGWVPELLLPKAKPKHTGSLDVDLALDHTKLDEERYATILETITAKGYRKGEKGFQYVRTVSVDGRDLDVLVEFLAAEYEWPKRKKGKTKRTDGFRILKARGCDLAFDHPETIQLDGKLPDGVRDSVTVQVASIVSFLVMKGMALVGRDKAKDAYDIVFCLKNYPGGPNALVKMFKPHLNNGLVQEGLQNISGKFRSPDDYGPSRAVLFIGEGTRDEQEIARRDAYERAIYFLRGLNVIP
jgi:predicted nucleotidyltransferase